MELTGKVALVTGGTKGIGAAAAIALARRGCDVAINGRHLDDDAEAVRGQVQRLGRRCAVVVADVACPEQATRAVNDTAAELGGLDVLVHSAGGPVPGTVMDVTPEDWMRAFDVHVHAVYRSRWSR